MDECLSLPWPVTWLGNPLSDQALAGDPAGHRLTALADVVAVTGGTRRLTQVSAGLLAAVLVGAATVTAALAARSQPLAISAAGLLVPVIRFLGATR